MPLNRDIYKKQFWTLPLEEVFKHLETSERGVSEIEVQKRIAFFGLNTIEERKPLNRMKIFVRQFKSPLIFILLIAGSITLVMSDLKDAIFIFLAAFVNAGLGYYQEQKAETALEHLRSYVTKRARVIRGGAEQEIDAKELVPGDVVHLTQGDRIPADARLIHVNDLDVNQSMLTGESLPVHKNNREVSEHAPLADRHCMVFGGTTVVQGFGTAVITATDAYTELGQIAKLVNKPQENKTPLQRALSDFAGRATGFIIALAVILFFVASFNGISTVDSFLIAVAVLVASIPEGLPIVITVILAIGVQRLAKRKGIVRQLSAAETLGSTSVILTDKTGTLTQAKMSLDHLRIFEREPAIKESISQEEFLLHTALLNVDVLIENPTDAHSEWRVLGKPLEVALVKGAAEKNIHFPSIKEGKEAMHILPFNSLNKFSASVYKMPPTWFNARFKNKEPYVLSLMGAPEMLLKLSDVGKEEAEQILAEIKMMANNGERVVAVAVKEVEEVTNFHFKDHSYLKGLRFLGTLSLRDPLRPNVAKAMQTVESSGIQVVIVTGDHEGTAAAIGRELGMRIEPQNIIDGVVLDEMPDEELAARLDTLKIVSRVSPQGKMKIVKAFQARGDIVAMNGDGINDAPALKQANIGIAMGSGTDVSKDVAELILLDDNFETIVAAVTEGRRILGNIRKAIIYMTSTILDGIILIGGSLVIGLPMPINPLQILWINFFTGSFPGIALAFEKSLDVTHAPQRNKAGIFNNEMRFLILVNGTISSLLLYTAYDVLLRFGFDLELVRSFIYATLGTYSLFMVLSIRSLRKSIFSYNPFTNWALNFSILFGVGLIFSVLYVPFLQNLFKTVALPPLWVLGVFGYGVFNIMLIELTKMIFHKEGNGGN